MTHPAPNPPVRSYGCSFACGNPYDVIVTMVSDGTTQFLCLPCFVRTAMDVVAAVTDPDAVDVAKALKEAGEVVTVTLPDKAVKPRGKNAPVTEDDDDMIEAFSGVITEDELPEAFR